MKKKCRVLVTGAGSGVGQGIIKALRISDLPITIMSCDIGPMNAGLYRCDESFLLPKVEDTGALDKIVDIINKKKINVVMIGSEFDLLFFSENKVLIEESTGAHILVAPPETVRIADDKWLTTQFLRTNGLPYAPAYLPQDLDDGLTVSDSWGYPLMLKARRGTASRNVHLIHNRQDFIKNYPNVPMPMLQRPVDIPQKELSNEYTCSVFKTAEGRVIGPFTARRSLRGGTSWNIEVFPFNDLNEMLLKISEALPFVGSLNIQLMRGECGPVPFELNARFSGTTAVRAHFGFNEPAMALRSLYFCEDVANPTIRTGVCLRYNEEVFLDNVTASDLEPGLCEGMVRKWF